MNITKRQKLKGMICYSATDMLGGGAGQIISAYYFSFLTFAMGLSPLEASLVTAIGKIWDGITDPVMGVIVDRTRTKWGSCRPYFLFGVIPVFVAYYLLWTNLGIPEGIGRFVYFVFAYMLWSTAYTLAIVPYESLLPRIVNSYSERTDYSSLRMIFSGVACVASTYIYNFVITGKITENPIESEFRTLGIVVGLMLSLPLLITFFGIKEKYQPPKTEHLTFRGMWRDYKEVLHSRIYRKYYALGLCGAVASNAISVSSTVFIYLVFGDYGVFSMGASVFTLVTLILTIKGGIEIAFFPLNVYLMKKYNKHRPYLVDLPFILVGSAIILFIGPNSSVWLYVLAASLIGGGVSCLGFVPMTLLPDLSDIDQMMYGQRREGVSAGLTTLGKKIVGGLAITLFGLILTAFGIDDTRAVTPELLQTDKSALYALKLMYCGMPLLFCSIMVWVSRTYNLDEKRHNMIKGMLLSLAEGQPINPTAEDIAVCEQVSGMAWNDMWISSAAVVADSESADVTQE